MSKSNDKKLRLKRETVTSLTADELTQVGGGIVVITNNTCGPFTKDFQCNPSHPTLLNCPRPGI